MKTVKRRYERWRRKATFCSFLMSSSLPSPYSTFYGNSFLGATFLHTMMLMMIALPFVCVFLSFSKPLLPLHIKMKDQKYFSNDKVDELRSDLVNKTKSLHYS